MVFNLVRHLVVCCGVLLCFGQVSAQGGPPSTSDISIAGVRPGMTKDEALKALTAFNPQLVPVEAYTSIGNGMRYTAPKYNFKPAHTAFFSTLIVLERGAVMRTRPGPVTEQDLRNYASASEFDFPQCNRGGAKPPREAVIFHVLFSPDLLDPRVVLIDEERLYCAKDVTVSSAIEDLYKRFTRNVTRSVRIRPDGVRVTPDTYPSVGNGAALLEWRVAPTARRLNWNETEPPLVTVDGGYAISGNIGGGLAVNAEIRPANDLAYMGHIKTLLWDDEAIFKLYERQSTLLAELDRLGITVDRLGDKESLARVRLEPPKELAQAQARRSADAQRETLHLSGRKPDAVLDIPKNVLRQVRVSKTYTFPKGTIFYEPLLADVERLGLAKIKTSTPSTWLLLERSQCISIQGSKPRFGAREFPCTDTLVPRAIPTDALVDTEAPEYARANGAPPRKFYRVERDALVAYTSSSGLISPGTLLYRAEKQDANPADLGFFWPADRPYTWFVIDPAGCAAAVGQVDCSQPIPVEEGAWKPSR